MDISYLIEQIEAHQSRGNKNYARGLFPSQRRHRWGYLREDNNIFFSALVAWTLMGLINDLPENLQKRADRIIRDVRKNYPDYTRGQDPATYNFWRHANHFPNGWLLSRFKRFAIPDDSDDSSLIYLTRQHPQHQAAFLKEKMSSHYEFSADSSALTPREYAQLKAYPTFFGKKILREIDACVICNVLCFNMHYRLPWTQTDEHSMQFLYQVLTSGDYRKRPFGIAPNYGNAAVILYHIARLSASFDTAPLKKLRNLVVPCLQMQLRQTEGFMEKLLLTSSLWRLQIEADPLPVSSEPEQHFRDFHFFQAGMLTAFQNPFFKKLTAHPIFHLKYRCFGYYWTLLLEHEVLKQRYYSRS